MRILGIDPGYERLGIAVLEKASSARGYGGPKKEQVIFSECFKTSAKLEFAER
jgi:Holliday junction resolvasome RuvABC endonuclease subunit